MVAKTREEKNLEKLLKVAKANADERGRHLANIEAAQASAKASLDWLEQSAASEGDGVIRSANPNIVALQSFMGGVTEKRAALEATHERLSHEIDGVRAELSDAYREVKKVEHLLEIRSKTARKRSGRRAAEALSELALRSAR